MELKLDFKNKRALTFLAAGILMLFIVIGYSGYAISFLLDKFNAVFINSKSGAVNELQFQVEKVEILKKQ